MSLEGPPLLGPLLGSGSEERLGLRSRRVPLEEGAREEGRHRGDADSGLRAVGNHHSHQKAGRGVPL